MKKNKEFYTLTYANFNSENGVSTVIIDTYDYGSFIGYAFLHPNDKKFASQYFGCDLAKYRALIELNKYILSIDNISNKKKKLCESRIEELNSCIQEMVNAQESLIKIYKDKNI